MVRSDRHKRWNDPVRCISHEILQDTNSSMIGRRTTASFSLKPVAPRPEAPLTLILNDISYRALRDH